MKRKNILDTNSAILFEATASKSRRKTLSTNHESVSAVNHDVYRKNKNLKNTWVWNVCVYFNFFTLVHVPSTNMEEAGFMTYTAAHHQGAIETLWLPLLVSLKKENLLPT